MIRLIQAITTLGACALIALPLQPLRAEVRVEVENLVVTLSPAAKWTLRGITFEGVEVGQSNGNYGTVIAHEQGSFIGAGHNEGGEEEVREIKLLRDGVAVNVEENATLSGGQIERYKRSTLGEAATLESTLRISPGRIDETVVVTGTEAAPLHTLYPLMLIWSKESTHWAATTRDGRYLSGSFQTDGSWKVEEDVRWLAVYHPQGDIVTLTTFPEDFPKGSSRKHAVWDHAAYHKQYFMASHGAQINPGDEFRYSYTVHFLKVNGDDWQGDVERFVSGLNP